MQKLRLLARELLPTGFTPVLESLLRALPEALCAVFVDEEGEAIDLATRIDGFDARVAGAETAIVLSRWRALSSLRQHGPVIELQIVGGSRSLVARSVGGGYDLVVLLSTQGVTAAVSARCATAAGSLRDEAHISAPTPRSVLRAVELRPSETVGEVPRAFVEDGVRRRVAAVLGVLDEGTARAFLVRTVEGEELLVLHNRHTGQWRRA